MKKRFFSLPTRISLTVTAALLVTTLLADYMAMRELRISLGGTLSDSLNGMIRRMALQLDEDVAAMRVLVTEEAAEVRRRSAESAARFLRRRASALGFAFDYGVILVDQAGKVTVDSLGRDGWDGVSVADQEFFQRTFALGESVVSEPFVSPLPDASPVAMVTAPIFDDDGSIRAVLAGGLDLARNRTLNQTTGVRASRYGQIGLFTLSGVVVAHSDAGMLLEQYENPLADALAGGGAAETIAADGTRSILAVAEMSQADWVLAGAFPADEISAPLERGFAAAHLWFLLGLGLSCFLAWRIAGRTVRGLESLSREMHGIHGEDLARGNVRLGAEYRDEAGAMAATVNELLDSLARARREVGDLSSRLAGAQERERRVIAADLHDSVCQTLALANMRLGGLRKKLEGKEEAVEAIQRLLEDSVAELRTLIFNLSPNILYELGLAAALEWYGEEFGKKYGLPVQVTGSEALTPLDEGVAIFLYRAAGELMTNAAKHSGAGLVEVEVGREGEAVCLEVADNGCGMPEAERAGTGFGLRHLRERVRQLNGFMGVTGRPGGGTVVRIVVPA